MIFLDALTTYWHEWPSNFSNGQSVDGLGSFFVYLNNDIGGYLGILIVFAIFGISFMALKAGSSTKAFGASAFITAFLSIFLMRMGILAPAIVIILVVLAIIGVFAVRDESQRGL